ncbi:homoserine O-acetyltransferase MetX [Roseateles terrae]|uniref:Serine O-succinyltransferase n=1 Tax=Roseateles terrae TaxID=431060 RepID=A0ABR6GMW2_9BURK|nr:homoserine O-acetyltransferase [Roseateles terrae]MBB3193460.1 homoserine O-acetyltransferase/serine/homoserine O-acetyltransferase [Roseateles terrae]OWQ89358.1 homoserine O-acetyltransferase [Roseateles terrae]
MMEFIPPATHFVALPDPFTLKRGGRLTGARLAYETVGQLNADRSNALLILTGLSPDAHVCSHNDHPAPGWWEGMVGPGRPVDTGRWFVVCVNSLGSCKGSTGPASLNPVTGRPYGPDFPALSVEDLADAAAYAVRALGIEQLAAVLGASMGGMTALSLVARHPGLARHLIHLSGAVHAQPLAIALRALQRELIQSDPDWQGGHYDGQRFPLNGMVAARKLGLITYRSGEEWAARFGRERLDTAMLAATGAPAMDFAVEGYLACQAHRFVRSFDPNAYLALSRAIDTFDLGDEAGGNADVALRRLRLESALVIGVKSDFLFPVSQQRQVAEGLQAGGVAVTFHALDSLAGHDAFLADLAAFEAPIRAFLDEVQAGQSHVFAQISAVSVNEAQALKSSGQAAAAAAAAEPPMLTPV